MTLSFPRLEHQPAAVTAVGSFPGSDIWETCRMLRGELPEFPVLPELPARGPGADMIGRTLGLLGALTPDLAGQTTSGGWRLAPQTSADLPRVMRRAAAWLAEDIDAAEASWHEYSGAFKIQVAGPWTLAAAVELSNGERVLSDPGGTRDLAHALPEAVAGLAAQVRRAMPRAALVVQLDEPALAAALQGSIPSQSGFRAHAAVEVSTATQTLRRVAEEIGERTGAAVAIHCCASSAPIELMRDTGAQFISVDLTRAPSTQWDEQVGELLDAGQTLIAGLAADSVNLALPNVARRVLEPLLSMLHRLGIDPGDAAPQLALSTTCGLAGASSPAAARVALETLTSASRGLLDKKVEQ